MAELFATGRIIDAVLVLVALEAAGLLIGYRRRRRGSWLAAMMANLTSGAVLMLAVRAALTGADWTTVAGCLAAALVAHLTDLCLRMREGAAEAVRRT